MPDMPTLDDTSATFLSAIRSVVGSRHVLVGARRTRRFSRGFRSASGQAHAVVRPGTLIELWRALQICAVADVIVLPQASNTGLTGGSTPAVSGYDRPVVIFSTTRIRKIFPINDGREVVCLAGATLHALEQLLRPLEREPHSVIGSSCLGASVVGGICNNSGGALVRRGPAYTERAIYARARKDGRLELVNHLGIDLGSTPEEILQNLEDGAFGEVEGEVSGACGSDPTYHQHVRDIDAVTPARFNADPRRLFESSGSAGKVLVFGVRLDTFPMEKGVRTFYAGCDAPAALTSLRRTILRECAHLPIAAEYIHQNAFNLAVEYGRDQVYLIEKLGTARLPRVFALKEAIERMVDQIPLLPKNLVERLLQFASKALPSHVPARIREFGRRYEHHLLIRTSAEGATEMLGMLNRWSEGFGGNYFECDEFEARRAFLHRFVVAGAAIRFRAVHPGQVEDIIALDVALPRNEHEWFERLPEGIANGTIHSVYYGHFLCHVFHQDYIVRKGQDCEALKSAMLDTLEGRGAKYPAEHNVGHLYTADPELARFYRDLDPGNLFNAGVGRMSKLRAYGDA